MFWAAWAVVGQFVHALVILLLAMAVSFLLTPVVDFLDRYMWRILACLIVYGLGAGVPTALWIYLVRSRWVEEAGWAAVVATLTSLVLLTGLAAIVGVRLMTLPSPIEDHGIPYAWELLKRGLADCPAEIILSLSLAGLIGYFAGGWFPKPAR